MRSSGLLLAVAFVLVLAGNVSAQESKREPFPGLKNYFRIDATASNGSEVQSLELAIPELAKRGFKAVINVAGGPNAEAEGTAVRKAGMKYFVMTIGIEGSPGQYDPAKIDPILKTMTDPANQPVILHSGNGHRTAMIWMIKRVVVDEWSIEGAGAEATTIGLVDDNPMVPNLWKFTQEYIKAHPRSPLKLELNISNHSAVGVALVANSLATAMSTGIDDWIANFAIWIDNFGCRPYSIGFSTIRPLGN